MGKNAPRGLTP